MVSKKTNLFDRVSQLIELNNSLGKPHIAFGLKEPDKEILNSLRSCIENAEITLVGPKDIDNIKDFNKIVVKNPEETLAEILVHENVDGIIRGTLDFYKTYDTYRNLTGEHHTVGLRLLEDTFGRHFFLGSASNAEGWDKEERLQHARNISNFLRNWEIQPKVAVFSAMRHESHVRKSTIKVGLTGLLNKTFEDAEWIVQRLQEEDIEAKNCEIELDNAIKAGFNILIPVNGMVGNQIFRALLLCGGKVLTATMVGLSRCYEDNSRTEKDFEFHVKWLVANINNRRQKMS